VVIGHDALITHPASVIPDSNASHPSVVLCAKTTQAIPWSSSTRRASANAAPISCSKNWRSCIPEIHAILNAKIGTAQDPENFLKSIIEFALPLERKVCWTDDQDAISQSTQL
jgi:hypothetical protein